ncbi:hypothetical protein [Micromonospora haikouensis]|uniref:hypothetical protein n=1 Tax=Micromonospora haikouensis TaxID=686309 RepID=UPI0037A2094D
MTDGEWLWRDDLRFYVATHHALTYIRANGYRVPDLQIEDRRTAGKEASGFLAAIGRRSRAESAARRPRAAVHWRGQVS